MHVIANAACWAFLFLLLATANAAGWVTDDSADVMFAVLPIIAWLSISGQTSCPPAARKAGQ
jgi:hypothetical protein